MCDTVCANVTLCLSGQRKNNNKNGIFKCMRGNIVLKKAVVMSVELVQNIIFS